MTLNNKAGSPAAGKPGKMTLPTKRTVNLAGAGQKKMKLGLAIPAIILIVVIAVLFSKFAVIDRLIKVSEAERAVAEVQAKVTDGYRRIDDFGDLVDIYAHYTFSGMTNEELNRTDRVKIVKLIRDVILPEAYIESFNITGNNLTVSVTDDTLQDINLIAQRLQEEDIVSFCTVTTAATNEKDIYYRKVVEEAGMVTAQLNVYLVGALEEVND